MTVVGPGHDDSMYVIAVGNADKDGDVLAEAVEEGEQEANATGRTDTTKLVTVVGASMRSATKAWDVQVRTLPMGR